MDIAKASQAELVGLTVTDPLRLDWTGPKPMGVGVEAAAAELRKQRYERAAADVAAAAEGDKAEEESARRDGIDELCA